MKITDILLKIVFPLCLVAFLLYVFFFAPPAEEVIYAPVDVGGGEITVQNQYDLNRVTLGAEFAAPGFISIHESLSGAPAQVIGSTELMEPGQYDSIEILLDQPMLPGYRYITLMTADDGDGVFEPGIDLPVEFDGAVVRPDFIAQPE